jgi:hypothetical protein
MKYYQVTVAFETETESGKIKKVKELYLVDALSCTEAEAKLVQNFTSKGTAAEYEVIAVAESKIVGIV